MKDYFGVKSIEQLIKKGNLCDVYQHIDKSKFIENPSPLHQIYTPSFKNIGLKMEHPTKGK